MELFKLFGSVMVDNKKANQSIQKTDSLASKLSKGLGSGIKTAAKWGAGIAAGAIAGGTALFGMATKAAESTDRIDKLSQKIGISRKGFQEWDFILSQSGTDIEKMQVGLKTLVQRMGESADGTGKGAAAFDALGISATDLNGELRSQEEVFEDVVRKMQEMPEGAEKSQLAFELFGKAGLELMPLLNSTGGSVDELKQKAADLGIVLSDDAIDAGVQFTDTMDQMKRSIGAMGTEIGVAVMPIVQQAAGWVIDHMPQIREVAGAVFTAVGDFVTTAVDVFKTYFLPVIEFVIEWVKTNWPTIKNVIETVLNTAKDIITSVTGAIKAIWERWGDDIVAALKIAWDVIKNVIKTTINVIKGIIQTVTGAIKTIWEKWGDQIKATIEVVWNIVKNIIETTINVVKGIIQTVTALIKGDWEGVWNGIKSIFTSVWDGIKAHVDTVINAVKNIIKSVLGSIKSTISGIWNGIKTKTSETWDAIKSAIEKPINKAKEIVKGVIDSIKGFFNFKISWPHIPMPHFAISPSGWKIGDLLKGSIPSLGIDWYAKGGIFDKPTIFATSAGLKGVGEAGPEAVVPIEKLQQMIDWNSDKDSISTKQLSEVIRLLSIMIEMLKNTKLDLNDRELGRLVRSL